MKHKSEHALCTDQKKESNFLETSSRKEFPSNGGKAPSQRGGEELSHSRGTWSRAAAPLHQKEPADSEIWAPDQDTSQASYLKGYPAGKMPWGRPSIAGEIKSAL